MNKLRMFFSKYPLVTFLIILSTLAGIALNFRFGSELILELLTYSFWALEIAIPFVFGTALLKTSDHIKLSTKTFYLINAAIIIVSYLYALWILPPSLIVADPKNTPLYYPHSYTPYIQRPQFFYQIAVPIFLGVTIIFLARYLVEIKTTKYSPDKAYFNTLLRLLLSVLLGYIYGLAMFIGLEIANLAIQHLWGYPIQLEDLNWEKVIFIFSFNFIFYKVAINNFGLIKENKAFRRLSLWLKNFVKYILTPLFILYSIILYPYIVKILITGQWPSNTVTPLALAYSLLALTIIIILRFDISDIKRRIVAALVPAVVGMQIYGLALRINAYGLTVNRAELLLIGIAILFLAVYFIVSKKSKLIVITWAALMVILATPIAFYTSRLSQEERLYKLLTEAGVKLQNKKIISQKPAISIETEKFIKLIDQLSYFWEYHGLSALKNMLNSKEYKNFQDIVAQKEYGIVSYLLEHLHIYEASNTYAKRKDKLEYEVQYRLKWFISPGYYNGDLNLGFKFFKTPITILKLENVSFKHAYIKKQGKQWILFTETNEFLIPQQLMHYLTKSDLYRDPQIILLESRVEKAHLLVTDIYITKWKDKPKIEVGELVGILLYTN